jgi:lipoprotein signal peptidase
MFYFRSGKEACLHGFVWGGKETFTFNNFNIADMAISTGVEF